MFDDNLKFIGVYETLDNEEDDYQTSGKYIYLFSDIYNNVTRLAQKNLRKYLNKDAKLRISELIDKIIHYKNLLSCKINDILYETKHYDIEMINYLLKEILNLKYTNYDLLEANLNLLYHGFGIPYVIKQSILDIIQKDINKREYNKVVNEDEEFIMYMFMLQTIDLSKYPTNVKCLLNDIFKYKDKHGYLTENMINNIKNIGAMDINKMNAAIIAISKLPYEEYIDIDERILAQDLIYRFYRYGLTKKQINSLNKIYEYHLDFFKKNGIINE